MKRYEVEMNVTLGYVVGVMAESEEQAKDLADETINEELNQGWGYYIEYLSVKED